MLIVITLFIFIYYSYNYILFNIKKNKISNDIKKEISVIKNIEKDNNNLEYYRTYYSNNDIVGSLNIEGTSINTLLVKGKDNEYYLNHSIKKEYDIIGSIYVDYRVNLNSKQINIYGHNSNVYDVMFKELENYKDREYYLNHKYIILWDGDNKNKYEIFSVQIVTNDYEHIDVNPTNWTNHINKLKKSIYETNVNVNEQDYILVIQTCLYEPINSLLIINAKKI